MAWLLASTGGSWVVSQRVLQEPAALEKSPGSRRLTETHLHTSLRAPGTACSGWSQHSPAARPRPVLSVMVKRDHELSEVPRSWLCWEPAALGRYTPGPDQERW